MSELAIFSRSFETAVPAARTFSRNIPNHWGADWRNKPIAVARRHEPGAIAVSFRSAVNGGYYAGTKIAVVQYPHHMDDEPVLLRARAAVAASLAAMSRDREVTKLLLLVSEQFEEEACRQEIEEALGDDHSRSHHRAADDSIP